jgi:ABC-type Mn2+/Zn2+ transport system ATPase subunit
VTAPAIKLHQVDVGYRSRPLFTSLNLEIAKGSFHAILGPNGAGKTTLLKTIAGILQPLRGKVEYAEDSRIIGYVPQKETLDKLYLFSAHDVALMGACREFGPGRRLGREIRERADGMLALTGASEFSNQLFSQLSGGQKQRTLIARALMTDPQVLILDEPTAGVDPAASQSILELLLKLQSERHMTVMLVTHDLALVRRHVRDAICVHEGGLHQGPSSELLAPKHLGELLGLALE